MSRTKRQDAALVEFGRRVRARREALGWSLEEAGEKTGLHWTYVGQVERSTRNLTLVSILKLAKGLDVDPGDLIRGLHA
jgi:transcriptional regulator with XRE-family HTH domain